MITSNFYQSLFVLAVLVLSLQNVSAADGQPGVSKQQIERVALMKEFGVSATALKRSYRRLSERTSNRTAKTKPVGNGSVVGYLILGVGDNRDILASLKSHNDKDMLALMSPPFEGRISLGVYNNLESARRRRDTLATYAVESEIVDRKTSLAVEL